MIEYRQKTKMFVDPKDANTATLAEIAETLQYMVSPQGRNTWTIDDLQERITKPVSHGPPPEHEFAPQEFHILSSSVETQGIGRRREAIEVEPYFYPQMENHGHGIIRHRCINILSKQHNAPIPTPNVPLCTQWNVPGAIPDMGDILGVNLCHQFSVEADQVEAGIHRSRRNPDRQAQRWDRPCGTSSRHHEHQNE
ncbi:hypothetical protein GmHk_19G054831 [Glycine max]|nr:hypothetical protein GmHk_19G054831 [Glycine max]